MRGFVVATALMAASSRALALSVPLVDQGQQKPLGRLTQPLDAAGQYMSCEETYGDGWERCGDRNSRFCYSPALGQTCCGIDNSYCDEGTWCAPVAGYCCLNSEDLATCAMNAGFEMPSNVILGDWQRP